MSNTPHHRVAIVGAGFGGIGVAHQLHRAGVDDLILLERSSEVGGVWRDNAYPGAACDVQSHLYSFSFAPNPDWSREFSPQAEIHDYLKRCVRDFGLMDQIRFGTEVTGLDWDAGAQRWSIATTSGDLTADFVVMAAGVLSDPAIPELPGIERFHGPVFHSAEWRHDVNLAGKSVAVVGTGASAIQFVPAIQPEVGALTLFQRTAAWVMPRHDKPISERRRNLYRRLSSVRRLKRLRLFLERDATVIGFRWPQLMRLPERGARKHLQEQVKDPVKREKLTPHFRFGCKRVLISNDYLRAIDQPNADVVTSGVREVREHSVVDGEGVEHDLDVLIYGTGFNVGDTPWARIIRGREGLSLADAWDGSPKAHLGTTVNGFPNLSLIHGPNCALGHSSMLLQYEHQFDHIVAGVRFATDHSVGAFEPSATAQSAFVDEVDAMMEGTVWVTGGCTSWYLDRTGRNSAIWPGSTIEFGRKVRGFRPAEFELEEKHISLGVTDRS